MLSKRYIKLLKKYVLPYSKANKDLVLEEDVDSVHRLKLVRDFKESVSLRYYINIKGSLDLLVVETYAGIAKNIF